MPKLISFLEKLVKFKKKNQVLELDRASALYNIMNVLNVT